MKSLEEAFGLESPRGAATPEDLKSYLIERANFHGVDPRLAASIFEQESSSGRNAGTSSAGARGPMQVMPATFRQMYPDGDINNPRHNIEAGIRYLKHGRDTLGTDDPRLLAAGYYQGYNRDSLKRGEIVDTNTDPRFPSVHRYSDEVSGRLPESRPRMKSLEEALGLEGTSVFPLHRQEETTAAPKKAPERDAFAYMNDFMIDAGNAVAGLAKAGVDVVAPGSAASQSIDDFIKQGQASQSDWKKAEREKLNQALRAAPDEWSKVSAYLSHAVIDDPLGLVAEAAGNIGPFAAFGKVLQAARIAEPMAEKIAMGLASTLAVGEVRGNIYDKIQATPDAELQRVNPDYARARQTMTEAQAKKEFGTQFVQHLPELALTAVVGALGGKYGLEALAVGVGPKVGRAGRAVIGTVDEGGQGAVEQLATNVGVGRVDPRQTLGEDVPLNAAMEGLIGGVGGALSGSQGQQAPAPRPQPQPGQAAAPGAQPPGSVPPTAPSAAPAADAGHGGGIPASAEDLLPGNAAATSAAPAQPQTWTEKGAQYRVVPVDEMLWHKYIRPDSQAKVDSFEEYRQRYPTITHMRLKSTDGGQTWKPSRAPFIGSEEKLLASRPPETPVMEAPEEVPKAEEVAPEVTAIAAEPAPNPEQRPASPEAESQAPVVASGESQGDAGVAPGQAAEAPDRFDPGNLTPGSPEYERAYENWAGAWQSSKDAANSVRRREENKAAVEKRNGWRARFREWFLRAKDGDSITDTGTEASWKVIEKTRKDGTKTKALVVVDENGNQILGASTGIGLVGDRVDGLEDGGIEEESGSAYLETQPQSLAAGLGKLMEEGEAVTRSVTETGPRDEDQPKSTVRDESQGQNPPSEDARSDLDAAAHAAATSPTNDLPEPTPPQKEAGNYQKGHIRIAGLDISIENPQGSKRSGVDRGGKSWEVEMSHHYGYIRGTVGKDKDHIDVFVKPGTPEDYDGPVFVVDQKDPGTHEFDEHKVMLGFDSLEEAKAAYRSNYAQDWRGMQAIGTLSMAEFKAWLKEGDTTKPLAPVTGPKKEEPAKAPRKEDMGAMFDDVLAEELAKDEERKPQKSLPAKRGKTKEPATPKWVADLGIAVGDRLRFTQDFDYFKAGDIDRIRAFSPDSVQLWNDERNSGTFLKRWQIEKAIKGGIAVVVSEASARGAQRTASDAATSAAKNTAAGLNAAIDGLGALFGGKGKLSSGLSFDEETYAKAKPLFQQAIVHFQAAGTDLKDAMRAIVRMVLDKFGADAMNAMKPYVVRFMEDVRDGKIRTQQEEGNGPTVDSGTEPGSAQIPSLGEDGGAADRGRGGEGQPGTAPGDGEVLGGTSPADVSAPGAGPDRKPGSGAGAEDGRGRDGEPGSRDVPDGREGAGGTGLAPDGTGNAGDVAAPPPPKQPTLGNYHVIDPESLIGGSPRVRFDRNKAAIETFLRLQEEGRDPTKEERDTLARYIGWGSFGQELFLGSWDRPRPKPGWEEADKWLRGHLGKAEWESAQRSIINAHYTDPPTVTAMWNMVRRMGFKGGRVLEPSVGIGNFLGLMPRDLEAASQLTGIELDALTGGMAKLLYPDANIQIKGYQDSATADNFYDLVIGNWPFDARGPSDRRYRLISPSLHDYFFLKAVDQVKPGGLVIGITSSGTMDKQGKLARLDLARRADLIASFRLPSGAFEKYAGTAVVTDIIVLRKRGEPNPHPDLSGWIETVEIDTPHGAKIRVNEYYKKHPDHVLGTLNYGHGTTQGRPGMIVDRPADLMRRLTALPERVPEGVFDPRPGGQTINYVRNSTVDRENSIVEGTKGGLFVVRGEFMAPLHEIVNYRVKDAKKTKAREDALRALISMRRAYGALVDAERDGDATMEAKRKALNAQYLAFVKDNGSLNRSDALTWMRKVGDPFWPALAALERKSGDSYVPARILTEATVRTKRKLDKPSVRDAFVLGRNESMRIDMARIAEQAGVAEAQAAKELLDSGAVFKMPDGSYEARDVYLSGNVRRKMREALEAKASGEDMERNIAALKEVIPEDTPYYKIEAKLGAPWISVAYYRQYVADLLKLTDDRRDKLGIAFRLGTWKVKLDDDIESKPEARSVWGTSRVNFGRVLAAAFNNTKITVWDQHSDGSRSVNEGETGLVTERIGRLREEFSDWIWKDYDRRMALEREFNEVMNAEADPQFDGSFLTLEGMALHRGETPFSLRQHQVNAIWRGLVNRRGVYAHEVGTGKTYTMGGLAVESRRYGIARKPLLLAHNANAKSVTREIQEMYPGARVLYLGGLDKDALPVAMRQIANDDWDAVVIPHSRIGMFGLRKETLMAMAAEEIAAMEQEAIEAAAEKNIELTVAMMDEFDNPKVSGRVRDATAKELVKARNAIIARIEDMAEKASKEGAIPFEELGVDMILVDEAHEFGKPPLATKMALRGLNKSTSNRSLSLRFLTSYVRSVNGGTGVHLFTGTPITNTLNEIYNLQRYVSQDIMERDGVSDWDSWFNTFADSTTDVELNAAGQYEPVTRLASFVNVAELRRMIGSYTDIVFADDMPEFAPRPTATGKILSDEGLSKEEVAELVNGRTENPVGRPYKKIVNDVGAMSPEQMEILSSLQKLATLFKNAGGKARMEMMRSGHPASPVILETNASNAAMDARLYDITAPDFEGSKVNRCVKNVARHYAEHPLATQVIFLERGFSDESVRVKKDASGNVTKTKVKKFNLVNDIVEKLAAQGVKRSEIAVVAGGISDEKKKEIADAMNRAEIRVVIGQTATLGVGVNMQINLRAMHHMDAPWRPGDLEQRNGRGHRQGNKWNTVLEYRYITDRLDGRRWQVLAVKERFIKAFLKADKNVRIIDGDAASMDEDDDILGSLSEAAGDPRILLLNKYKQDVERLENRQRTHMLGRQDAQHRLEMVGLEIEGWKKTLAAFRTDAEATEKLQDQEFTAKVNGKDFDNRKEFDQALKDYVETLQPESDQQMVATVYGIPVLMYYPFRNASPSFTLKMARRHEVGPSSSSIESVLRGMKHKVSKTEARLGEMERSIPSLQEAMQAPFPREADLKKKRDLYAQVEADLDINPVPPPAWLRQSAPVGTEIRVAGKPYQVSGHQYAKDGYYVIVETADGARLVPYLYATDESGQPLYEPRKFEAPPARGPRPLKVGEFVVLNADKTSWKVLKAPFEVKNGDQKRTVLRIQNVENEDEQRTVGETEVTRDEAKAGPKRWEIPHLELTAEELRRAKVAAGIAEEEPRTADFDYLERMATAFSRSDRRTAPSRPSRVMRVRDVEAAIAPIRAVGKGLPTIHVVQHVSDLPRDLARSIRGDGSIVRGAFYRGQIYLIASNLSTPRESVFTMLHEAAHFGLQSIFGPEIDAVLMKMYRENETVRRAADRRRAKYPSLSQVKATEEVLADWAGKNVEPTLLQRLVAWVRDWFRRRGVQLQMTNADVLAIIARARGAWQRPSASRWTHVYSAPRQSQRMAKGEDTLFSSAPSSGEDFAASTLSLLSDIEDLYQQPKSDKKTLTEIAAEIDPGIKVLEMGSTAWNLDGMAIITMPDGVQAMIRTYKDGAVDIDASLFVEGVTRGTAAYNLAATYAHNNGWMFIGDPAGLTDAALFRRTENMISSAMKFETTDHLYPHERQVAEGLQWEDGKDNLANLLKFSRELLAREMPEAADLVYDVDAKEFRNERTGENLDEAAFRDLARESRGARAARAGEATLKRAALLNTLVRATSPEARRSILGQVVRQLREGLDPALVGTFYSRKSPPGSRPASAAPSQAPQQAGLDVSGLRQRAQNFLDRAKMEVDPFAFVPDRKALETMRYQLLGRIARFDEIAADIKTIFSTASEEDQQAAYRYFLTPGADKAMIPNPSVAAMAERTKALIESVGDALVARGAMTPEVREAHRGRYLPQVYLKFLLGDQNWKALGAGKKISDRGYLKQRKLDRRVGDDGEVHVYDAQTGKVLDQEFLDAVLGPVEDPGYLSSLAIVRPMRDMAILDYLAAIAENAQWVLPKSVIEWRGKRVSAHWAKVEAERLRRQARHQDPHDAANARKIAEELDVLADEALGEIEGEHADYRQIPNTARYGRLRGIWVRKEIYDDLMGVNDFLPADPGWAMSLLGYGGIGTRLTSLWKAGKVSLNPPAQVRNFVSNMVLLQLSGVPLRRIPTLFVRAFRQIMLYNEYRRGGRSLSPEERSRVRHYLVALKYGVTESTFNAQELYRMQRDLLEIERASGLLGTWGKIKLAVGAVMDYASDKYQLTEALGKTMKIMDEMERGQPEHEAALAAQEALFDYSLVSKNVRYLRNAPMGMPFLTFAVKVAPLLLKTARHHPERYLPWIALAYGLPALLAAAFDVDDDDIEALKKALPEWLQERGHAYVLPWKDDTGRWQVIDMGYFFPWTTWTEPIRMAAEGEAGKTVQALGLFSGPLTDLITAVMTGRDSFTGREIVAPGDPPKRQLLQIINYLWTMAMPPIITEHGAAGHAVRAATGQTDRFGDPLSTSGQAALRAVGVNVYPIHPETSRTTNVRRMMREIADTEYALRKRLQDRGLSDEGKADLVKEYIAEVDRRRQKLMDYIEQSEVHPNLATETLQ